MTKDHRPKQDCTCTDTCARRGKPFPSEWSWRCQGFPYVPTELDMHEKKLEAPSSNLVSRLRQRLITVPKPDTTPFDMPAAGYFQMGSVGGTHKPGDSAGVLSTCASGGNKLQEHIYAVDPLCEEAAQALERIPIETNSHVPQLWRIDQAARAFVDAFDCDAVKDYIEHECAVEWRELNEALFDGRPAMEPAVRIGAICPDGLGECNRGCKVNCARAIERDAEKASEPFERHPDYCMAHGGHLVDSPACKLAREREKSAEKADDRDPTPEHLLRQGYRSGKVGDK